MRTMATLTELKARREHVGYSQRQLADILQVTRGAVGMWEIGKSVPNAGLLPLIADTLLCSIDHLYGREEVTKCQ